MQKAFQLILISILITGCEVQNSDIKKNSLEDKIEIQYTDPINLDPYTLNKLNSLLVERSKTNYHEIGKIIDMLSSAFLGTPYQENMLHGSENIPEKLIIDFRGLDCFTYLDYVEALRKSTSQTEFIENVIRTRYVDGNISFLNRKHFFTDWAHRQYRIADDVTTKISPNTVSIEKYLNKKDDSGNFLPGLPVVKRNITYIPSRFIDENVISRLQSGDFIGIYTNLSGLDVTHVGFFIMTDNGPMLRNASSRKENKKVVDSPFMEYVTKTPGIIILRALK
ncbi:DUF1460 domain-containing protein [Bartonella sp. B41]